MEVIIAIPLLMIPLFWPVVTGLMAISFGRKFWTWFFIGIPLPFVAAIVLLCLPDRRKKESRIPFEAISKTQDNAVGISVKA